MLKKHLLQQKMTKSNIVFLELTVLEYDIQLNPFQLFKTVLTGKVSFSDISEKTIKSEFKKNYFMWI